MNKRQELRMILENETTHRIFIVNYEDVPALYHFKDIQSDYCDFNLIENGEIKEIENDVIIYFEECQEIIKSIKQNKIFWDYISEYRMEYFGTYEK